MKSYQYLPLNSSYVYNTIRYNQIRIQSNQDTIKSLKLYNDLKIYFAGSASEIRTK